ELVLLLFGGSGSAATGGDSGDGDRRSGRDVELLFERVEELLELDDGHVGDGLEDLVLGGHGILLAVLRDAGGVPIDVVVFVWCRRRSGGLLLDEGLEAVGELPRERGEQTCGLGERGLEGAGDTGEELLARRQIG